MPNPFGAGPVHTLLHALPVPSLPLNIERWIPGQTPISTTKDVALAVSVYLAIIFGGQDFMDGRPAYRESHRGDTRPATKSRVAQQKPNRQPALGHPDVDTRGSWIVYGDLDGLGDSGIEGQAYRTAGRGGRARAGPSATRPCRRRRNVLLSPVCWAAFAEDAGTRTVVLGGDPTVLMPCLPSRSD